MQSIYAMHQKGTDTLEKEEKFLYHSIDAIQDLYLIMLSCLVEICKKEVAFLKISSQKHLATEQDRKPNEKFVKNAIFKILSENSSLKNALESRKITNWTLNDDYILILLNDVKSSKLYEAYMQNSNSTFNEDKAFIVDLFSEVIVANDKLYEYLEDYKLTWVDDIPLVNTHIIKQLESIKPTLDGGFRVSKLYKDAEDQAFVQDLFRKTVLNEQEFAKEYVDKTTNWDVDRIAEIDTVILKMAICELLKFPSIPVKVTLNEYLELAKEYSTPKSSIFINGILDNIVKELSAKNRIQKIGRGLL